MRCVSAVALFAFALCVFFAACPPAAAYRVGTGIADVTGPTAEVPFMGYAMGEQKGKGLHLRQKARAFVVANDDLSGLFAYVSADLCMSFQGVKEEVVKLLGAKFGNIYNESNVLVSGTHTHGGPGGFSSNTLYAITILGFQQENFDAITAGVFAAIAQAHENMLASSPGAQLLVNTGTLLDSNINRSPTSYLQNPQAERDFYGSDTDKNMTVARFVDASGKDIGMINWFAVHGTSMTNTNCLVTSDNKGYACYLFEKFMNPPNTPPVSGPYVAAFAQTNSGDVSPRTRGAFCPDGVTPCERMHSTCDGKEEGCNGIGPGKDEFESTQIIAAHQVVAAAQIGGFNMSSLHDFLSVRTRTLDLYPRALPSDAPFVPRLPMDSWSDIFPGRPVGDVHHRLPEHLATSLDFGAPIDSPSFARSPLAPGMALMDGPVDFRFSYVDMESLVVAPKWTGLADNVTTCHAAMGDAFAAGTTDGNGALNFVQGDNTTGNPFWNMLAHILSDPTKEEVACQAPKPILFNTGDISWPTPWTQGIQPVQILRIGNLFILGCPVELTTMAGRRLRASTAQVLRENGVQDPIVVINEISNAYCGYTATFEEYQAQRYEAASTIFGPHELAAWQQEFARLAVAMATSQPVEEGPHPPDLSGKMPNLLSGVVFDSTPSGKHFGDVEIDALPSYSIAANSSVNVTFWGASPRNQFELVPSFFNVEMLSSQGTWTTVAFDSDWETKFYWQREGLANSLVSTQWDIPADAQPGTYRIHVFGRSKSLLGSFTPYEGYSRQFTVTP